MKSPDNIQIYAYWTNEINSEEIHEFIKIKNTVFSRKFNFKKFEIKFLKNIYGPSIIVLAYSKNQCIGARAFWRNDLNGILSYQPTDSAVLKEYRGKGIFSSMTRAALSELNDTEYIYMYPNDNSLGAYKRLGWNVVNHKKYKIYNPYKDKNEIDKIDDEYFEWMLSSESEKIYYTVKKGIYYLIYKRKYNFYLIVSEIEKNDIKNLKRALFPILLIYTENGKFGRGVVTTTRNIPLEKEIPIYKMDTLF